MKRIFAAVLAILIATSGLDASYLAKDNYVRGAIDSSNILANAETTGDTFAVKMSQYSRDIPNAATALTIYSATCSNITDCPAREIVKISAASCTGTSPNRICTCTITSRNQESTTHTGDWAAGSRVQLELTAGMLTEFESAGGSMVYPGAGVPLSTGSAWGTSYSTDGTGDCSSGAICLGGHTHSGYLTSVGPTNMSATDFGSFTCNGTTCTIDNAAITPAMFPQTGISDEYCLTYESTGPTLEWQPCGSGGGYTNLTSFVDQTAWRLFYSNGSGDVTELALGATGTYLKSNGATAAPTFDTPSGAGDMLLIASQEVTGLKTFDKDMLALKGTSTGKTTLSTSNTSASDYIITVPPSTGTLCLDTGSGCGSGGSMTWPASAGIAVYSGSSSWGTSLTDNSANWNTAYGWGNHASAGYAMANADTTGSSGSLKSPATTGKTTITGPTAGTTWAKTVRDADDTILEQGGSYTPTGTWNWGSALVTWPTFNQNTTGTCAAFTNTPSGCSGGQYAYGIAANGNLACSQPGAVWGSITGTLSSQTDIIDYIDATASSLLGWVDVVRDYHASGSTSTTTTTCTSGSNAFTLASATGWSQDMGIAVASCGASSTELVCPYITISGTIIYTWNDSAHTSACNAGTTQASAKTVYHDDTRALQTAFDVASKNVHIPAGSFNITSGLTLSVVKLVQGDGKLTYLKNRRTDIDMITVTMAGGVMQMFGLTQYSGVTPTAGSAIKLGTGTVASSNHLINIWISSTYNAIDFHYATNNKLEFIYIYQPVNDGFYINNDFSNAAGANLINNVQINRAGANGIEIVWDDNSVFSNCYFYGNLTHIKITDGVLLAFTGMGMDNLLGCTGTDCKQVIINGGTGISFVGGHMGNANTGFYISGGSYISATGIVFGTADLGAEMTAFSFSGNGTASVINCPRSNYTTPVTPTVTTVDCHANCSPTSTQLGGTGAALHNYGQSGNSTVTLPTAAANYGFTAILGTQYNGTFTIHAPSAIIYYGSESTPVTNVIFTNQPIGSGLACTTFKAGTSTYYWKCNKLSGTTTTS